MAATLMHVVILTRESECGPDEYRANPLCRRQRDTPLRSSRSSRGPVDIVIPAASWPADGLSGPGCSSEVRPGIEPPQKKLVSDTASMLPARWMAAAALDIHVMVLTPLSGPGKGPQR